MEMITAISFLWASVFLLTGVFKGQLSCLCRSSVKSFLWLSFLPMLHHHASLLGSPQVTEKNPEVHSYYIPGLSSSPQEYLCLSFWCGISWDTSLAQWRKHLIFPCRHFWLIFGSPGSIPVCQFPPVSPYLHSFFPCLLFDPTTIGVIIMRSLG